MLDVDEVVNQLRVAAGEQDARLAVRDALDRLVADPAALAAALGSGDCTRYERLYVDDSLTILHLVLPPGMESPIHDHHMWACVGIYGGQENNAFFRRAAGGLEQSGGREIHAGEVLMMGTEMIHAVDNPLESYLGAIHVYGGDLFATERSRYRLDGTETPYPEEGSEAGAKALAVFEENLGRGLRREEVAPMVRAFLDAGGEQ